MLCHAERCDGITQARHVWTHSHINPPTRGRSIPSRASLGSRKQKISKNSPRTRPRSHRPDCSRSPRNPPRIDPLAVPNWQDSAYTVLPCVPQASPASRAACRREGVRAPGVPNQVNNSGSGLEFCLSAPSDGEGSFRLVVGFPSFSSPLCTKVLSFLFPQPGSQVMPAMACRLFVGGDGVGG
jgi:hypothetical protein